MNRSIIIINKLALGGAEEFFCELGERFSDHYTFAVLENDYSYNVRFKLKKYNINKSIPRFFKILIKLFILCKISKNYKNIICFDNETGILSHFINKNKTKLVIHTYLPLFYKKYRMIYSSILFNIYKNCGIVCISQSTIKGFEEFTRKNNLEIPFVYNLINYKKLILNNSLMIKEPVFFQLSRLEKDKNIELSIKLINFLKKEIDNIKLIIFGDGSKRTELNKIINKYNLSKNIFLKKFSKNPFGYLKKKDVFLNFSNYEGWSRVVHECAILGLRGISFDSKYGPREILINDLDKQIDYPYKKSNIYLVNVIDKYNTQDFEILSDDEKKLAHLMKEVIKEEEFYSQRFKNIFKQSDKEILKALN